MARSISPPSSDAPQFAHFAAIDWSGAVGARQPGIAIALCATGSATPVLVRPGHVWSRAEVLAWLTGGMPLATLVGLDIGPSLPFVDCGAFFPGWSESPADARALWALVDRICADDAHLAASAFVDHSQAARYFRRQGGRTGDLFGAGGGRLRATEFAQRAQGLNPYSNLNLVGAAQVGKASLTGMRVLHRLRGALPFWPFDPIPAGGSLAVEIYTTIAALAAGRTKGCSKMRSIEALNAALAAMGSDPVPGSGAISDHKSDALLAAAWLRANVHRPALWNPPGLTPLVADTEGWTFGVT